MKSQIKPMIVIPAVDIKQGKCVRLLQGNKDKATVFSDSPVRMALKWEKAGANWLHIVDLDGAFQKSPRNLHAIKDILSEVHMSVQVGGGIRHMKTIEQFLQLGINRVIIGTEAVKNPSFVKEACQNFPTQIVVGIDARNGKVAIEGWTENTQTDAIELAKRFEDCGVVAINFTDIHRDGMQTGPNIEETKRFASEISIPVIASGGVSNINDILNLLPLEKVGVIGVITGRAIYEGSLDLEEAINIAQKNK